MVEETRPCVQILTQLASVQEALRGLTKLVMRNYLENYPTQAIRSKAGDAIYDELMDVIFEYSRVRSRNPTMNRGNRISRATVLGVPLPLSFCLAMAVLCGAFWPSATAAHEPIFMMSHEAPGKGAFDVHTEVRHERQGDEREFELEQEFSYGLTRDLAFRLTVPFMRKEVETPQGQDDDNGLADPKLLLKWRFWDKDLPGVKYAVAGALESSIPTGEGDGRLGRDKPSLLGGLAHGREGLFWYYFVDARYQYHVEDNNAKPGDRLFLDAAYGIRPELRGLEETDIVYFFELNYLHESRARVNGLLNPDSGGDFLFFSPEILISPTNWIMLRGGVQIPILQSLNGRQEPKDFTAAVLAEFRFDGF